MSHRRLSTAFFRRRRAVPPWSPASLPGVAGWWRADLGTFQDSSGTMPAVTGDPVGGWVDQSGAHLVAAQASALKRPQLAASALHEHPALSFDGSDDFLVATFARASTESLYVVGVFESSSNQTLADASAGNARRLFSDVGSGSYPPTFYSPGGFLVPADPQAVGAWFAVLVQCDGSRSWLRVAGVTSCGTLVPTGDDLVLGTYGDSQYGVTMFRGLLAEVLVVGGRVLSPSEVDQLASYTLGRYGLVL